VRAADPAVDAEELDPVRLALEHALTVSREPEAELRERKPVAQGRCWRELFAPVRLDEPVLPRAELDEDAVEGLLPEPDRSPSGHRRYDEETVRFLRAIKEAQAVGFTPRRS